MVSLCTDMIRVPLIDAKIGASFRKLKFEHQRRMATIFLTGVRRSLHHRWFECAMDGFRPFPGLRRRVKARIPVPWAL